MTTTLAARLTGRVEFEQRQREEIKSDVSTEQRIGFAKRGLVPVFQKDIP